MEAAMSLRECRECGHPVPGEEKACPSCGAPVPSRWKPVAFAVAGLGLMAVVFLAMFQPGKVPRNVVTEQSPVVTLQGRVDRFIGEGVVTKAEGRSVWVEPALWQMRSDEEKVEIAKTCGILAGLVDGTNVSSCQIRDNRNGKPIAEWSAAAGLKPAAP
jgi:hypothetical protein